MLEQLDSFKDKTGKFSYAHLWPHLDDVGNIISATLKPAWCFWNGCSILNAAPTLAPFACVQTAQIGSNSISERGHKSYKFIIDKRRAARLGRDRQHGRAPLGIEMVMHRENLKFIGSEQTMENEQSKIEIVLRSFSVGDEAYFMKQWLSKRVNLVTR